MSLSVLTARCDRRRLDRLELRIALERDVGRLQLLLVDARGLRDLREQHRFGRLRRCRAPTRARASAVLERDLLEVGRQRRRRERPRAGEVRRREPAAGDEVVDRRRSCPCGTRRSRCCSPTAAPVPGTGSVVRLAGQQNQLRRAGADEHLRHRRRGERLARQVRLDVLPVLVRRQLLEAVGQRAGRRPRALRRRWPSASVSSLRR